MNDFFIWVQRTTFTNWIAGEGYWTYFSSQQQQDLKECNKFSFFVLTGFPIVFSGTPAPSKHFLTRSYMNIEQVKSFQ